MKLDSVNEELTIIQNEEITQGSYKVGIRARCDNVYPRSNIDIQFILFEDSDFNVKTAIEVDTIYPTEEYSYLETNTFYTEQIPANNFWITIKDNTEVQHSVYIDTIYLVKLGPGIGDYYDEWQIYSRQYTHPRYPDTDMDGLTDGQEVFYDSTGETSKVWWFEAEDHILSDDISLVNDRQSSNGRTVEFFVNPPEEAVNPSLESEDDMITIKRAAGLDNIDTPIKTFTKDILDIPLNGISIGQYHLLVRGQYEMGELNYMVIDGDGDPVADIGPTNQTSASPFEIPSFYFDINDYYPDLRLVIRYKYSELFVDASVEIDNVVLMKLGDNELYGYPSYSSPWDGDCDDDGVDDCDEGRRGSSQTDCDSDEDGWTDIEEGIMGSDPNLYDTDFDGIMDSEDAFPCEDKMLRITIRKMKALDSKIDSDSDADFYIRTKILGFGDPWDGQETDFKYDVDPDLDYIKDNPGDEYGKGAFYYTEPGSGKRRAIDNFDGAEWISPSGGFGYILNIDIKESTFQNCEFAIELWDADDGSDCDDLLDINSEDESSWFEERYTYHKSHKDVGYSLWSAARFTLSFNQGGGWSILRHNGVVDSNMQNKIIFNGEKDGGKYTNKKTDGELIVQLNTPSGLSVKDKVEIARRYQPILAWDDIEAVYPFPQFYYPHHIPSWTSNPSPLGMKEWAQSRSVMTDKLKEYLDFLPNKINRVNNENDIIRRDNPEKNWQGLWKPTINAHVFHSANNKLIVQYWFVYPYDVDWVESSRRFWYDNDDGEWFPEHFNHLGDRELIQLAFYNCDPYNTNSWLPSIKSGNGFSGSSSTSPNKVTYARHYKAMTTNAHNDVDLKSNVGWIMSTGGRVVRWKSHPVVFPEAGKHGCKFDTKYDNDGQITGHDRIFYPFDPECRYPTINQFTQTNDKKSYSKLRLLSASRICKDSEGHWRQLSRIGAGKNGGHILPAGEYVEWRENDRSIPWFEANIWIENHRRYKTQNVFFTKSLGKAKKGESGDRAIYYWYNPLSVIHGEGAGSF